MIPAMNPTNFSGWEYQLIEIIKFQKLDENGSLIEGLSIQDQIWLLEKLGVDE